MAAPMDENYVLSDVHTFGPKSKTSERDHTSSAGKTWLTRFSFEMPEKFARTPTLKKRPHHEVIEQSWKILPSCTSDDVSPALDDDGDMIIKRQCKTLDYNIFTETIQKSTDHFEKLPKMMGCRSNNTSGDFYETASHLYHNSESHLHHNSDTESTQKVLISSDERISNSVLKNDLTKGQCERQTEDCQTSEQQVDHCDPGEIHSETNRLQSGIKSIGNTELHFLTIEHKMDTPLTEVGFQVWSGALLLCDYLIHKHTDFQGAKFVDLGAGTGITSIVAALFAEYVLCTDYLTDIVEIAERNWDRNKDMLPGFGHGHVSFRILDLTDDLVLSTLDNSPEMRYMLTSKDVQLIEDVRFILAAEVIYDDELTDAFFKTIYHLLCKTPAKTVLLTLEKRVVFSAYSQDVCSPAYQHFLDNVTDLTTVDEGPVRFKAENIGSTFPQYFHYTRVKELELWRISSYFLDKT